MVQRPYRHLRRVSPFLILSPPPHTPRPSRRVAIASEGAQARGRIGWFVDYLKSRKVLECRKYPRGDLDTLDLGVLLVSGDKPLDL